MIQRIQSIFLALAGICILLLFAFKIALFDNTVSGGYLFVSFFIYGTKSLLPDTKEVIPFLYALPLVLFAAASALLSFAAIFRYKSRPHQLKMIGSALLFTVLLVAGILLLYVPYIEKSLHIQANYLNSIGIFLPLVALVFLLGARWGIRRDEKLVRSADRLR